MGDFLKETLTIKFENTLAVVQQMELAATYMGIDIRACQEVTGGFMYSPQLLIRKYTFKSNYKIFVFVVPN